MKPNVKNLGVSISSQRRFLRYWARLLEGDDPRSTESAATARRRLLVLEYVKVTGDGLKGPQGRMFGVGNDKIAVQVGRSHPRVVVHDEAHKRYLEQVWKYKDSIVDKLRQRELDVLKQEQARVEGDTDWDDREKMFVHVGGLVQSAEASTTLAGANSTSDPDTSASRSTLELRRTETDEGDLEDYASTSSTVSPYPPSSSASASPDRSQSSLPTASTSSKETYLIPHTSFLSPLPSASGASRTESEAKAQIESDGGILVDGEKEIMLKFLVGETGKKHGKLPTMVRFFPLVFCVLGRNLTPDTDDVVC